MSRIGRLPIPVPSGVEVTISGAHVTVKGPKGTLSHTLAEPIAIAKQDDGTLLVTRPNDERLPKALHGLSRTLVANMVQGVTEGYTKSMEIVGVGYRVAPKGREHKCCEGLHQASTCRIARKASCGTSTEPICFMRFFPAFCLSRSLRLREISPP